jgi:hypothetical protein
MRYEKNYPDRRPKGIRTEYDYLIFGLLIGGTSGSALAMGQSSLPRGIGAISTARSPERWLATLLTG